MTTAATRYSRSSSLALGLVLALLMVLGVGFAAFFISFANEETFAQETDAAILAEMRAARAIADGGKVAASQWIKEALEGQENSFLYALKHHDSGIIEGNLSDWPEQASASARAGLIKFKYMSQADGTHRDAVSRVMTLPDGSFLLVGRDVTTINTAQWFAQTFGWAMIVLFFGFAVACLIVGWYVANRMNRIADIADLIMSTGNLSERVPVDSSWDDLSKLSAVLNRLLDELETTIHGVKSVSDNIAHDLRTPLTRLRGDLDRLPDSETRSELLNEVDNILGIFTSLLRITAIETEKRKSRFAPVALEPLLADVVELYEPLAEDKNLQLMLKSSGAETHGDRDLLFQLFSNLVDNAIKFTSAGEVLITVGSEGAGASVSVCDTGPGIEKAERDKVLRRFYRVDKSRSESGNGLGLAMVAAIAKLHEAKLALSEGHAASPTPGLCCTVILPSL